VCVTAFRRTKHYGDSSGICTGGKEVLLRMRNLFRCEICNLFFNPNTIKFLSYTPYGSCGDDTPRDPQFVHQKCWDEESEDRKELTRSSAWKMDGDM
jgi:hypothetical protein